MVNDAKNQWAEFLNPDIVRTKFVTVGLFMVAHEVLLNMIKDRPLGFFSDEHAVEGGRQRSDDYRREILDRDPDGKGDALRGSRVWLQKMGAIDEADIASEREFTDARNVIAHELRDLIGGGTMPDFAGLFPRLIELVAKIDRWWTINVEIDTNPDFADLAGQEIDEGSVTPGTVLSLQILSRVALGEEDEAWELYRAFMESEGTT